MSGKWYTASHLKRNHYIPRGERKSGCGWINLDRDPAQIYAPGKSYCSTCWMAASGGDQQVRDSLAVETLRRKAEAVRAIIISQEQNLVVYQEELAKQQQNIDNANESLTNSRADLQDLEDALRILGVE